MGKAGNIGADLRFGIGVLTAIGTALLAGLTGRREPITQSVFALVGLVLAGCGFAVGRVELALGRRPKNLTTGLSPADVQRALATVPPDDA